MQGLSTKKIKSVIFDIDNTLYSFADSNKIALDKLREYARENFGWTAEEFDEKHLAVQNEIYSQLGYNGSCRDRMLRYQKMLEHSSLPLHIHAVKLYELYWSTMLETLVPFEGVEEIFKLLKDNGIKIGIGSDMTPYIQMLKLEKMKVLQYVDFIVTSEEAGLEKPSPELFQMCIKKAGFLPEECIFIGDDLRKDYYGSKNAGICAVWFNRNHKSCDDDSVIQIDSLMQLWNYLNSYPMFQE